jgi:hypothetical protein
VDSNNDLNVYTSTLEDGTRQGCCGAGSSNPCCIEKKEQTADDELGAFAPKIEDLDFNEWAGKCNALLPAA